MAQEKLLKQLDSFDNAQRRSALGSLANIDGDFSPVGENVNMHFHSFYSFNAEGYSPSHIVYNARKKGLYAAGLCDFDVLDGLEEFITAGELLGLRTTVNLETRAFLSEFSDVDMNSPGEPGVTYVMGAGFAHLPETGSPQADKLASYRGQARQRNLDLIERINKHLPQIEIDYEKHVLPLTPSGTATERHIIQAYINRAEDTFAGAALSDFLGGALDCSPAEVPTDRVKLSDVMRAKLAKRGGVGYVQPSEGTFPAVSDFFAWVASCDAIPMITWLDGTSKGESKPEIEKLLQCQIDMGGAALNIVPDRNWNISDPNQAAIKQANLDEIIKLATSMNLPINIGTEMNKQGQPFVDDLAGAVLKRHKQAFTHGAKVMAGHSILLRYAGVSYISHVAANLRPDVAKRNDFFASIGSLPAITTPLADKLRQMGKEKAMATIISAVEKGTWS